MHLFYSTHIENNTVYLDENDSRHAVKVLRLQSGDRIDIVDGNGHWYETELSHAHAKKATCTIVNEKETEPLPYRLHMVVAPTKNIDRFEWFLEKATEMGVTEITPVLCENSERKTIKEERLNRILISAMKQSLKAQLPVLHPLKKLREVIEGSFDGTRLMAHCEDGQKTTISSALENSNALQIFIGPEGDFSTSEIKKAQEKGIQTLSLGPSRLRTETAAVFAVSSVYNSIV